MATFYVGPATGEVVPVEAENAVAALAETLTGAGYEGYEPGAVTEASATFARRLWVATEAGLADFVEEAELAERDEPTEDRAALIRRARETESRLARSEVGSPEAARLYAEVRALYRQAG